MTIYYDVYNPHTKSNLIMRRDERELGCIIREMQVHPDNIDWSYSGKYVLETEEIMLTANNQRYRVSCKRDCNPDKSLTDWSYVAICKIPSYNKYHNSEPNVTMDRYGVPHDL